MLVGVNYYELPSEVENGTLTVVGFTTLYGNALANVLRGTDESETFDGRAGADTMIGGLGGDTYYVDNAGDQVVEAPGNVSFWDDKVYTSLAYYEIPVGVELLEGTSATQTLVGSDEDEWIMSAGGGDTMIGRGGNDLYLRLGRRHRSSSWRAAASTWSAPRSPATRSPDNVEELQARQLLDRPDPDRQRPRQPDHRHPPQQPERHDRRRPRRRPDDRLTTAATSIMSTMPGDVVDRGKPTTASRTRSAPVSPSTSSPANVEKLDRHLRQRPDSDRQCRQQFHQCAATATTSFISGPAAATTWSIAGAGMDNIFFGATLTGADIINGGAGVDTLVVQGPYGR